MRRARLLLPALVVAASALLAGCASDDSLTQYGGKNYISGDGSELEVAQDHRGRVIDFSGTTADGTKVDSSAYAGQVYVVNFWWANCPPCRAEAPELAKVASDYAGQGVPFLGVNVSDGSAAVVDAYEKRFDVGYPSILDAADNTVQLAFSKDVPPNAVPTTLVMDREGRVAARVTGYLKDPSILSAMIDRVLAESGS